MFVNENEKRARLIFAYEAAHENSSVGAVSHLDANLDASRRAEFCPLDVIICSQMTKNYDISFDQDKRVDETL